MKKAKLLLPLLAAALVLPAAQNAAAANAGKRSVIERINGSLEKSRRVRESKKRRSEMEKRERAKAQPRKEQARQEQAQQEQAAAPKPEPSR